MFEDAKTISETGNTTEGEVIDILAIRKEDAMLRQTLTELIEAAEKTIFRSVVAGGDHYQGFDSGGRAVPRPCQLCAVVVSARANLSRP